MPIFCQQSTVPHNLSVRPHCLSTRESPTWSLNHRHRGSCGSEWCLLSKGRFTVRIFLGWVVIARVQRGKDRFEVRICCFVLLCDRITKPRRVIRGNNCHLSLIYPNVWLRGRSCVGFAHPFRLFGIFGLESTVVELCNLSVQQGPLVLCISEHHPEMSCQKLIDAML